MYCGISVTQVGSIIVASTSTNSAFLPGARSRAKPYAMNEHDTASATITEIA